MNTTPWVMTTTPWFPGTVRPVRPGVYERRGVWVSQFGGENTAANGYAMWDGLRWCRSQPSALAAAVGDGCPSDYQPPAFHRGRALFEWRGLTTKDGK